MNEILASMIIIAVSSAWTGWLIRGWWEARISEQYADAVLDFLLGIDTQTMECLCDECYDPPRNSPSQNPRSQR